MPNEAPSAQEIRAALDELLGWQGISRSPQLAELLRYVVEKTLDGDEGSIKAYSIAVDVFGRPQDFDPQSDPIVRVQARRLRTLLEQFYVNGSSRSSIQVRLPLGRYVPEFVRVDKPATEAPAVADVTAPPVTQPARWDSRGFLLSAILGLVFTLVGVGLAVLIVRWVLPSAPTEISGMPSTPAVSIGTFDNLTGVAVLDDDAAAVGTRLGGMLAKFDDLRVVPADGEFLVRGSVQEAQGLFTVKIILSRGSNPTSIVWSTSVTPQRGQTDTEALTNADLAIARELGSATGPLQAAGLAWLGQQKTLPNAPNAYVCQLYYLNWRDSRLLADATSALDCYDKILAASPDQPVALSAEAGVRAWRLQYELGPDTNVAGSLEAEAAKVARAVSLSSDDSFVYEQQGLILARQHSLDAALGSVKKAMDLNPASTDAKIVYGLLLWLNGQFDVGQAVSEEAIAALPSPPTWYYMTRAFDALRQRRYYDAIDAAQALGVGEGELGPAIALAAAPVIGRNDLIDRYRPMILANPRFQATGILPWLDGFDLPPQLVDRLREGLILAGIPPAALTAPFKGDGTPRQ